MSRDVSDEIKTAIESKETYKIWVKAEIDPSRSYFSDLADDDPYDAEDYSVPTDTPVGQCMIYSPTRGGVVTFIVDPITGVIYAMDQGSVTKNNLGITADEETKPAVTSDVNGKAYIWYCSTSGVLEYRAIDLTDFSVSGATNMGFNPPGWTIINGSPTCLDRERVVYVYQTSKGGMGVSYYTGTQWIHWGGRFISANQVTDSGYWSIYTTAAILDGSIYVYSTDIKNGEVRGVIYEPYQNLWSDLFVALPADLSRFCVTNAVAVNGYIHIAGQFHRTEDLADAQVYSLVVRSKDGKTFSWDRFTMISMLGYQFQIAINSGEDMLYASDRNSVGEAKLSYFFAPFPGTREVLAPPNDILEFSTGGVENATLRLKAHDEAYLDHEVIKRGSRCKIYLGYSTASGAEETIEYTHYMTYIIDGVEAGHADGVRRMLLILVAEGIWKTDQIAFPFYSELISKSTILDDCDERDNMYPATGGARLGEELVFDFWTHMGWDGGDITTCTELDYHTGYGSGAMPKEIIGAYDHGFRTCDLNELDFISGYPEIIGTSINVKLYGWGSVSNSARSNDDFMVYIVTMDEDEAETEHAGDGSGNSRVSSYARYPRYQAGVGSGSYPIEYTFTGLTEGHSLKYIAIKQSNALSGTTYSITVPERLEVTNCNIQFINLETNCVWLQTKPVAYDETDPTLLEVPAWGRPFVQFLTRPYTAFNFSVHATFVYEDGDDPIYNGTMGWGVVGIAKCGANYIMARFNLCSTAVELVKLRANVETVLASYSFVGESKPMSLMLEHSNGVFTVRHKSSTTWSQPIITHHWDEPVNGVISTSETGIMHVGIYGTLSTEGFRHCSLNLNDADGLAAMPQYVDAIPGLPTNITNIVLDDVVYTYGGKFTGDSQLVVGPYQGIRCIKVEGVPGAELAYAPDEDSSESKFAGYLFATSNGHTWLISDSSFAIDYSWHHCESISGNYIGVQNRAYITLGLSSLTPLLEGDIKFHPHGYWAFLWGTNRIWAKEAFATTLDHDATVKDMTQALCRAASVEAEYTGDWIDASESVTTTPLEIAAENRHFPGGYDVRFRIPALGTNNWIALYANNLYIGDPDDADGIDIGIKNVGGYLTIYAEPRSPSTEPASYIVTDVADSSREVRILFHDLYASVYMSGKWIHTFAWNEHDKDADDHSGTIKWPDDPVELYLYSNTTLAVTDLLVSELFDWREAIYIESEMSAASALGSVIQERPIEIFPTPHGGLSFSYHIERDTITYNATFSKRAIRFHSRDEHTSKNAGSDAVVYFRDIAFANDLAFADAEGFITRVMKLSGLDTGAKAAATLILEKANERQYQHRLEMRPDIRLEQGDRIILTYTLVGTDTTLDYQMIVENLSLQVIEGESAMEAVAREDISV